MAQTFYGEWFVQVVSRDAAFGQRFVVSGSDATDGATMESSASARRCPAIHGP